MAVKKCKSCNKPAEKLYDKGHCQACMWVTVGEKGADMFFAKAEAWATQYVSPAVFKMIVGGIFLLFLYLLFT
ncbi:hypothetical protein CWE21_08215 [Pseudidiomarina aquimaris]|uniref:Uncharacterized protein n=1 Tax=Pseudidiomarina aquimaris TaxID=641841 RepID=A0A432XGW5_9GAMM|nr:hypothetical protein [Pseudidiomarina aquimaris]RUO47807.1 hypothetical protein CWE21_08215 [Pseudidiomarina aquimaris]